MDAADIARKNADEQSKELLIFNPLPYEVVHNYGGVPYSIPSQENKSFLMHIAKHLGNHIIDLYIGNKDKNYPRSNAEKLVFND